MEIHKEFEEYDEAYDFCMFCESEMCDIGFGETDYACPVCGHSVYGFSNLDPESCEFIETHSNTVLTIPAERFKNTKDVASWIKFFMKGYEADLPAGHTLKDVIIRKVVQLEIITKGREE